MANLIRENALVPGTMSVLVLRALVLGAGALGVTPNELVKHAGVPEATLAAGFIGDPDARVPADVVARLWRYLPERSGDEAFGLWLADQIGRAPLTVASWVIQSSPNLGEGLTRALRFQRLLHDAARSELITTDEGLIYRHQIGRAAMRGPAAAVEFGFAWFVGLARRCTGRPIVPLAVSLRHGAPRDPARHIACFGPGLTFSAKVDELLIAQADLELPLLTVDEALRTLVESHAARLLERLPERANLADRVRRAICELLQHGAVTIDAVAQRLHLPPRTLQRHLRQEQANFAGILDEVRRSLAEEYLKDPRFSVQETAFLLGFSDVSAFHRAFQRWTGTTPSRFRAGMPPG